MKLFAALDRGAQPGSRLAKRLGADRRAPEILCNALVALGLLRKKAEDFSLTPLSATYLVPGRQYYLGDFIHFGSQRWTDYGDLARCVRTGEPARQGSYYLKLRREEREALLGGMDN